MNFDFLIALPQKKAEASIFNLSTVWGSLRLDEARQHVRSASKVMIVGTSLMVQPFAALAKLARGHAEKVLISKEIYRPLWGYELRTGLATESVPPVVEQWLHPQRRIL